MGKVIDLCGRFGRTPAGPEREDGGTIYRVRLCGPDRRWLGTVGGVLARSLALEGFYTTFEDPATDTRDCEVLFLRAGREVITETGTECRPTLIVAAGRNLCAALQGAAQDTVLLVPGDGESHERVTALGFCGTVVPLPDTAIGPEPLGTAVACIGSAARLLGTIRWTALEQAMREELGVFDSAALHRHLGMALEAFDRTAPWDGRVMPVTEEIEDPCHPCP